MKRGPILAVVSIAVLLILVIGGYWLAQRTILAKDEIQVRVNLTFLVHLDKIDAAGKLTGNSGIAQVNLAKYRLPAWFLIFPLRQNQMEKHGISEAKIVAAMRESATRSQHPDRVTIGAQDDRRRTVRRAKASDGKKGPTPRRIFVEVKGSSPVVPPLLAALKGLKISTGNGQVSLFAVTGLPIVSAGSFVSRSKLIKIKLEDRWHYPSALATVTDYLRDESAKAPPLPSMYDIGARRRGKGEAYKILK